MTTTQPAAATWNQKQFAADLATKVRARFGNLQGFQPQVNEAGDVEAWLGSLDRRTISTVIDTLKAMLVAPVADELVQQAVALLAEAGELSEEDAAPGLMGFSLTFNRRDGFGGSIRLAERSNHASDAEWIRARFDTQATLELVDQVQRVLHRRAAKARRAAAKAAGA